ncbi:virulence factor BrkB family protein [Alteromonas oceanisediminis]|uniref:virulence factor BrkB family protein n=1 Tax=Alteromonas oceanisediminis TaxID=2836180 RepID=UPI002023A9DB|nr:virulence factor BrkB family protein [Alteromonas oceanisediminis]
MWWKRRKPQFFAVAKTFIARSKEDKITVSAGHLAYVTLLSLVPFIMVFFTVMSAFPAFEKAREKLENFIFNNFVPASGDVVQNYMSEFVGNASQMGAVGILSLLIVALLLISNVDKTLNAIWRTPSERPIVYTLAIYWMVISLGPMLMGTSVVVSSYLIGLANFAEEYTPGLGTMLLSLVPSVLALSAFLILYMLVPNRRVRFKHAISGAILASILFEFTKRGFSLYVTSFPSYELIYGALAVVPILFVWIYLSWIVVLVGAEFTCAVTEVFEKPISQEPRKVTEEE